MLFARHRRAWWAVQPAVAVGSAESCQETGGAIAPHHENPTWRCDGEGRGGGQWRAVPASAGALTPAPAKPAPSWSLRSRLTGVPGWLCVTRGPGPDRTSGLLPLPVASVARKRLRRDLMIAAPLRRAQGQERPGPDPIAPLPVGRCRRLHAAYRRLERRLAALKAALDGLQDAVHRGPMGQDDEMAELRRRTALSQMARALSDDVRWRGI
jgi:hypothetical protein